MYAVPAARQRHRSQLKVRGTLHATAVALTSLGPRLPTAPLQVTRYERQRACRTFRQALAAVAIPFATGSGVRTASAAQPDMAWLALRLL